MMTPASAQSVEANQPGRFSSATPSALNTTFTTPPFFMNMAFHTEPTATTDATYGKKMALRKKLTPRILRFKSRARPSAAAMLKMTVKML